MSDILCKSVTVKQMLHGMNGRAADRRLLCVAGTESTPSEEAMTREAHAFLHEHGCINVGVMRGEPAKEAAKLSDAELAWRTHQILKTADMQASPLPTRTCAPHQLVSTIGG